MTDIAMLTMTVGFFISCFWLIKLFELLMRG